MSNIRLKYTSHPETGETTILEEDHYYPYGLKHNGYDPNHLIVGVVKTGDVITLMDVTPFLGDSYKYKFGGMEYSDEFDINNYDFGARNYDPALGRWMNIDPITHHSQSPYVAFDNNPVYYADPDGKSSQPPTRNITVTIITSSVDQNNTTTITQTTHDNTYTKNSDGSMSVSSSKSEITNTVSGDGKVTSGNTVNTQIDSYNVGTDGQVNDSSTSTESRSAGPNDTHSAFGEWTGVVSNYNKSNNGVYNKDMINKTGKNTTEGFKAGAAVFGAFTVLNSKIFGSLTQKQKSAISGIGGYTSVEGLTGVLGGVLQNHIGENNKYFMIYGVQHIENGGLIKPMKSPSGNSAGERSSGPKGGFRELMQGIVDLFK